MHEQAQSNVVDMDTGRPIPPQDLRPPVVIPPNVRLNGATTFQSPFFWLVIGFGLGVWIMYKNQGSTKLF